MAKRIDLPQTPRGDAEEQLRTLYSYLYQMAETLNNNLAEIGGAELTDEERVQLKSVIGDGTLPEGQLNEAETLKSLIVKTANFVQSTLTEYRINLLGEYVADGKFGKYVRRTGLDVDVTPTGIQQNFTFQEIIQGLKTYEINAKNYIKTGLLRTVSSIPVYGVAIGKDVVTFAEDGTETYNDGNKVAELTADELSFWQNGNKIASYTGSGITLYYGTSKILEIGADGMTVWKAGTKLAEMLSSGLTFYNNGDKRLATDSNGVTIYKGSTKLAELLSSGLIFYNNGDKRVETDSNGVTIYKGSTKLAELLGSALTFYHNGVKRAVTDANGMTFYKDSTKLAELLSSALKFYYNGTLRTQMDTDGVKIYDGSTLLMKITGSRISFYYNGIEQMYILNGKIYAANDIEMSSGKKVLIGNWTFDSSGLVYENSNGKKIVFGDYNSPGSNTIAGVFTNINSTDSNGQIILYTSPINKNSFSELVLENRESNFSAGSYSVRLFARGSASTSQLGTKDNRFSRIYVSEIVARAEGMTVGNEHYSGGAFELYLNPDYSPFDYGGLTNNYPRLYISHIEGYTNGVTINAFKSGGQEKISFITAVDIRYLTNENLHGKNIWYDNLYQNSSRDVKHDIQPVESCGEKLDRLRPVTFIYDDDPEEKRRAGLIYEETAEVLPEICTGDESAKAISYVEMIPMLLKEIQELRERVKALEEREGGN